MKTYRGPEECTFNPSTCLVPLRPGSLLGKWFGSLNKHSVRPGDVYSIEYTVHASARCAINIYVAGQLISTATTPGTGPEQFRSTFEFHAPVVDILDVSMDATAKIVMAEFRLMTTI